MQNEELGSIKISDDVIAVCAAKAVMSVDGVHQLNGGLTESLSRNILGKESGSRGIRISHNEEGLIIDLHIIVNYKIKIPQLAWEIQSIVKKEIESITELKVLEVNIHVQGVHLPGEENN